MADRPWTLDRLEHARLGGNRAGWSSLGNPGTFAVGAPTPWTADVFDPRCTDFGGQDEGWTCRFRYAPYDNLIDEQQQTRVFAELNGRAEQSDQLPHRGAVVGRRDSELVHHAVVPAVPADEHHHHGGGGRPSGPAGVLRLGYAGDGKADPAWAPAWATIPGT